MKVVALLGSPRQKGNSSGIASILTAEMGKQNHEIITYQLNELNYRGCQACTGCKTRSEVCVLLDDLTPVLKDVSEADVLILASPVYWGEVSAQLKGFLDRMYSYLTPEFVTGPVKHRLDSGKRLVFILAQGADEALYDDIFPKYNTFFEQLGLFDESFLIRGCDMNERDDYLSRDNILKRVREIVISLDA